MNTELPDDYHQQKVRERNAVLKWLWKPVLIIAVIMGAQYLIGGEPIGGVLGSILFIFGYWFIARFMDALTGRDKTDKSE